MADETRSVELAIDVSKAEKSLARLAKSEINVANAVKKGTLSQQEGVKHLNRLAKEKRDLIKINQKLDSSFGKTTEQLEKEAKAAKKAAVEVSELDKRLQDLDETSSRTRQQVGLAGDIGSAGRTLGGGVGAFGGETGQKVESAISAFSELPDALEALGQLKPALAGLPAVATKVAADLGTTTGALGGLAVGAIALGVVLAVGKKAAEESREALTNLLEAEKRRAEIIREGQGLTDDELDAKIAEATAAREAAQAENERNQAIVEGLNDAPVFLKRVGELSSAIGIGNQAFSVARDAAKESADELARLTREETLLIGVREDGGNEATELAERESELSGARDESIASTERALEAFNQASDRANSALVSRSQAQADAAEFAVLEAEIANEVQAEQENEHRDNLTRIASEGQDNLENLQSEFVNLASARGQALTDVDTKGNDKLSSLRDGFFDKQLKSTQKFQRETEKIETDTAKKRTKLLADLNDRLSDAARDNNVIAFLEAQREGNKALADEAINAQDAEQQRVAEFSRQREEERQVFEAKQAETLAAIQDEKTKVVQAFNERRAALAAAVQAEKTAIETRLQAEEQRFEAQELRESITADRQARRDEIRARHEQRNFDASIAALRNEAQLKQQIHQEELSALQVIQRQIASLQTTAGRGASSNARSGGGLGSSIFGRRRPNSTTRGRAGFTAFHEGGVIDFAGGQSEGFALVKQGEVVINPDTLAQQGGQGLPLSSSNALGDSLGQSINVTVQDNRTVQIGDIATVADVESALRTSNEAIVTNIHSMIEGATA